MTIHSLTCRLFVTLFAFTLATASTAFADATFVGATTPSANGFRGWFDIESTGVSCGVAHAIMKNNWGNQWCDTNPPASNGPVGGAINLNGFNVVAATDTVASTLLNPAGGTFATGGIATHTWGTFTNNGTVTNHRVVSTTGITNTTILNNGTWIDINPSSALGTAFGHVLFTNHGVVTDFDAGNGISWSNATNPNFPNPSTLNNESDGVVSVSKGNNSRIGPLNIINSGVMEAEGNGNIEFQNCSVTSNPSGKWNSKANGNGNLGFGFAGTTTMRGTFNGNAERTGTHRLSSDIVIDDDTEFHITGNGIYRWVISSFTVLPGKTLTNTGVFHTLNGALFTGKFVNAGTWFDDGSTTLKNATITNNGTYSRNGAGTFEPGLGSSTHTLINNGTMESVDGASQGLFGAIRFENNGVIQNKAGGQGRMFFNGTRIVSDDSAEWNVIKDDGAGFEFSDVTISGVFNGETPGNNDWRINATMNVVDDTTFNITGGGISRWVAGPLTIAAGKTLANDGVFNHLNGWGITGDIVNNGTFNYLSGGTTFNGHTFTNNGTINWQAQDYNNGAGTSGNSFTNNGTINVLENGTGSPVTEVINNGLIEIGLNARWGSPLMPFSQGDDGVVRLTTDSSFFDLPAGTLSGGTLAGRGFVRTGGNGLLTLDDITVEPGNPDAQRSGLQVPGPLTLGANCNYRPHVFGPEETDRDTLGSHNALVVDGTLDVAFEPGFTPEVGQKWLVVSGSSRTGEFSEVKATADGLNVKLSAIYNAADVQVVVDSVEVVVDNNNDNDNNNNNNDDDNDNVNDNNSNDNENPAPNPTDACGQDACAPGTVTMLPILIAGMGITRRRRTRRQTL